VLSQLETIDTCD